MPLKLEPTAVPLILFTYPPAFFFEKPIPCHVPRMAASLSTWVGGPDASQVSPLEEPPSPDSTSSSLPSAQNFAIAHFYT